MTPEQKFNRWLIDNVFFDMHYQRIESTSGSGIPDFNACWLGVEFWVESKVDEPLLRPYQWSWINRRVRSSGKVLILVDCGSTIRMHIPDFTATPSGKYMLVTSPFMHPPKSGVIVRRNLAQHLSIPMTF